MMIVGLSGTVASGKNLVAKIFKDLGAQIFDADLEVHKIFEQNHQVFWAIKDNFPSAILDQKIDRKILGKLVFDDKQKLQLLEKIIHPVIAREREKFIQKARYQRKKLVILNIPLLFEKNIHLRCHHNILVTAPKLVQKQRFLKREKMNKKGYNEDLLVTKFEDILSSQMPNHHKKKLADFIIFNGQNKAYTWRQVKTIFNQLTINFSHEK